VQGAGADLALGPTGRQDRAGIDARAEVVVIDEDAVDVQDVG
jgi:hypothetical protein